jgi:hypothetical protein
MSQNSLIRISVVIFLPAATGLAGCGGPAPPKQSKEEEHIRKIPSFVSGYQAAMKKQPDSLEEVRDWAVKEGKAKEEDFVSTRDKELYTIAYTGMGISVRETTGKDGKCYMMAMGGVSEVSAENAKRMMGEMSKGPKKGGKD